MKHLEGYKYTPGQVLSLISRKDKNVNWLRLCESCISNAQKMYENNCKNSSLLWSLVGVKVYESISSNANNALSGLELEISGVRERIRSIKRFGVDVEIEVLNDKSIEGWIVSKLEDYDFNRIEKEDFSWHGSSTEVITRFRILRRVLHILKLAVESGMSFDQIDPVRLLKVVDKLP